MRKKILALLMSIMMISTLFLGCGKSSTSETAGESGNVTEQSGKATDASTNTAEQSAGNEEPYHAVLVYIVAQDSQDQELVNEKFNELTKEQLNMDVTLMPMTFSTWMNQLPLMLAGGEQVDLLPMFSSSASTYLASDYIVDLTPYLEDNAPYIVDELGMDTIKCASIGNFIYGVPTMKERCMPNAMVFRTDCLKAAGIDASTIKTFDDVTAVFDKVQKIYPDMTMFSGSCNGTSVATPGGQTTAFDGLGQVVGTGVLEDYGQTTTVTNFYESDTFKNLVAVARDWYLKGYTSKDMPTTTDSGEVLMKAGNLFSYMVNSKPNTKQEKDDQTGYDTTIVPMENNLLTTNGVNAIDYGVGTASPDPAKAIELLNWISKTEEANDLLNWGIEGKHWELKDDGTIDFPEGVTAESCGYHQNMGYILPNQFNSHVWTGNSTDVFDQYQKVTDNAIVSKAYGFNVDLTDVMDQLAATTDVLSRYLGQITTGAVDPEPAIKEFNQELYNAGLQDIINLKQEQLDKWLSEQ